jgi:hypothetical protein
MPQVIDFEVFRDARQHRPSTRNNNVDNRARSDQAKTRLFGAYKSLGYNLIQLSLEYFFKHGDSNKNRRVSGKTLS